jgi:glucosamine-phosphate N-acetyltransferase
MKKINELISIQRIKKNNIAAVIELLQHISHFSPPKEFHNKIWSEFSKQKNIYSIVAVIGGVVVGYGSLVIEKKIRGGKMGHIEDIVTSQDHRSCGIGSAIIDELHEFAKNNGCYKVALQCSEYNRVFYEKSGFKSTGITMQRFIN